MTGNLRDDALPGQGAGALEEFVKAQRLKTAELQQHALAHAQVDVGLGNGLGTAGKIDTAIFRRHVVQPQPPQLVGDRRLKPEQAGDSKLIFHT